MFLFSFHPTYWVAFIALAQEYGKQTFSALHWPRRREPTAPHFQDNLLGLTLFEPEEAKLLCGNANGVV